MGRPPIFGLALGNTFADRQRVTVRESPLVPPLQRHHVDVLHAATRAQSPTLTFALPCLCLYRCAKRTPFAACTGVSSADRSQETPVVPQGAYKNVFDITYHSRDLRRRVTKEEIDPSAAAKDDLPPTPGRPVTVTYLGMAGDYDIQK